MPPEVTELNEKIIALDRVTRVVKGGRRFRFRATVVIGDGNGLVGVGVGKGTDAPGSIVKAINKAKKALIKINLKGTTIPHEMMVSYGGATVLLKPATEGTGVIAGGAIRSVLETAGVKDVLTKALGSSNKINNTYATLMALSKLSPPTKTETKVLKPTSEKKLTKKPVSKNAKIKQAVVKSEAK